jgi:hypothetical protein
LEQHPALVDGVPEQIVARQVCHQVANDLLRHEPHYEAGDEAHLTEGPERASLDERGWTALVPWILDVASNPLGEPVGRMLTAQFNNQYEQQA